jgi:hypothetical protein
MFRTTLIILLTAMTGLGGWFAYDNQQGVRLALELERKLVENEQLQQELVESRQLIEEQTQHIQELRVRLALLKIDHRVARIEVVSQEELPGDPPRTVTTVRFIELDQEGNPVGTEQEVTIEGKRLYLESLVIKFEDDYVEAGEFLRGTSLCLFKRVFSERVAPDDGTEIDSRSQHPDRYMDGDSEDEMFRAELWQKFWDYANDPQAAEEKGVRAIHGEAPFMEVRPGRSYRVELRASGGLSIRPE